ncbi:MAG: cell division protein FtsQ/DivIB [Pseudomonadota bacterium]
MRQIGPAICPGQKPRNVVPLRRKKRKLFGWFKASKTASKRVEPPLKAEPILDSLPEVSEEKTGLFKRMLASLGRLAKFNKPPVFKKAKAPIADPAPSRALYRWNRLMLRPRARTAIIKGAPTLLLTALVGVLSLNGEFRRDIAATYTQLREDIVQRPELFVQVMEIKGATPRVDRQIRLTSGLNLPVSSFDLDLSEFRTRIERLDAVKSASVYLRSGGVLEIKIKERSPVLLWRGPTGLETLDIDGVRTAYVDRRADYPELPLIVGLGAPQQVDEALRLYRQLRPIGHRLRALRRVGERRWDIVTMDGPVVLLPQNKPARAVSHILALQNTQDLFERSIAVVDMRLEDRPVIRIGEGSKTEEIFSTSVQLKSERE